MKFKLTEKARDTIQKIIDCIGNVEKVYVSGDFADKSHSQFIVLYVKGELTVEELNELYFEPHDILMDAYDAWEWEPSIGYLAFGMSDFEDTIDARNDSVLVYDDGWC